MEINRKRPGDSEDERRPKRGLHHSAGTQPSQDDQKQPGSLQELKPFDIIIDVTGLQPSQALEASPALNKEKYLRDVWNIFKEDALIDPKLAEMHQRWFECRQPDMQSMWESRYPSKGTKKHTYNSSTRQATLRAVLTIETIPAQVPRERFPKLHRSFSILHLDYIMLMCVLCLRSNFMIEARQYFPDFEEQFEELVQLLKPTPTEEETSHEKLPLATIPAESQMMVEGLLIDPSTVKSLEEIAGCEMAKKELKLEAYIHMEMPHLIKEGYGCKNILFHGPRGTGKTTLAQAIAVAIKMPCYKVNISHLVDKWLGASERNVKFLFEIANTHAPSVIIFDEIESICGVQKLNIGMVSAIKTCISRYPQVLVIGTTNLPWTLDAAFIRRFQTHIFVSMPTEHERQTLLQMSLARCHHSLVDADIAEVAKQTDGFTGDALERCVNSVANGMAKKLRGVTRFKAVQFRGQRRYMPAGAGRDSEVLDRTLIVPSPFSLRELLATVEKTASERDIMRAEEEKHAKWSKQKFIDAN